MAVLEGAEYGVNEVTNPVRVITSTVKVKDGELPVVPVKPKRQFQKDLILNAWKKSTKQQ